jgi:hypothetical protein
MMAAGMILLAGQGQSVCFSLAIKPGRTTPTKKTLALAKVSRIPYCPRDSVREWLTG